MTVLKMRKEIVVHAVMSLLSHTGSYHITEENVYGSIQFKIPFVFQSYINPHQSIDVTKAARLAKEMESLSTSLPLSPSASIFVCYDEARPDVMKV